MFDVPTERKIQLRELSPKHRGVAALLAQGTPRHVAAAAFDYTDEYVTWLGGDPLFQQHVREMNKLVDARLELLYEKSVDVIADQMVNGSGEDKLKAARLQLEATSRVGNNRRDAGAGEQAPDYLEILSQRLVKLLRQQRERTFEHGSVTEATPSLGYEPIAEVSSADDGRQ